MNYSGETALITGGGSGIGFSFAKHLTAMNIKCVLVGKDSSKLNDAVGMLPGTLVDTITADLSDAKAASYIKEQTDDKKMNISLLINNAGTGLYGPFCSLPEENILETYMVNTVSPIILIKKFLPDMLQKKKGIILNVVSTAAFRPGPDFSIYNSSKSGLYTFSLSLAAEIYNSGVSVTSLCPGPTLTKFYERTGRKTISQDKLMRMSDPDKVALCGLNAAWRGKPVLIYGTMNAATAFLSRCIPSGLMIQIMKSVNRFRKGNGK